MSILQERRYKEVAPEDTVKKLKGLLKKLGIEVEETWSEESSVGTYSLRICIKGTNIGQNGKGMTKEFAMASAYAEFFERFQNGIFRARIERPTEELLFAYAPDERCLSAKELISDKNSFFEYILKANGFEEKNKVEKLQFVQELLNENNKLIRKENSTSVPYYSVKNNDIEYIPNRLFSHLYDTNGMCAGNSKEEALIEGLSEILERYVAIEIFKNKITLPEIPDSYISGFPKVKAMVERLRKNNKYYFRLVDCSFGGKYPVAGLYIIEKNTGKFGFKLGAHPDYGIAMERCFTEAAQGRDIYEYAETCIFDFYTGERDENKSLTEFLFTDFASVPYKVIGEQAKYEFTPMPDVSELDNKTILKNMVNSILAEGKDVLIRDVSVLGFPTFSIIVPGMSEVSFDPNATYFSIFVKMQELLKDLSNITLGNIKDVIKMMEIIVNEIGYEKLSILISLKEPNVLPCEGIGSGAKYFLAICYIMNRDYGKAVKILEDLTFICDNILEEGIEKIKVKAVYYYKSALDKTRSHKEAMYYINLLFDKELAECINISFAEQEKILIEHYGIKETDYVENDDSYYLPFMRKLREAQRDNPIDQLDNRNIFN